MPDEGILDPDSGVVCDQICTPQGPKGDCVGQIDFDEGVVLHRVLTPDEQLVRRYVKRFRGGLVFKAHRPLYDLTLGSRVIKKKRSNTRRHFRRSR